MWDDTFSDKEYYSSSAILENTGIAKPTFKAWIERARSTYDANGDPWKTRFPGSKQVWYRGDRVKLALQLKEDPSLAAAI